MSNSLHKPIKITQPLLPDPTDFNLMLKEIWDSRQLSNNSKMVLELERRLCDFLKVDYLSVFSNGTIALQIACKLLGMTGEVITTPFTFPATVNVLAWNNATPVFCDIEADSYNMNPDLIESLITDKTTAIMPVHVYGNPCDFGKIQRIADHYGLKVLYDAAHAFGVTVNGRPIGSFGDITMFSFHATKVFNTIEGGALSYNNVTLKARANEMRNFGIQENGDILEPGINGKMNELQAAVGVLLLEKIDEEIEKRKNVTAQYSQMLSDIPGIKFQKPASGVIYNYPYFIISVNENEFGLSRDALYEKLIASNVIARKYFYPLCSNLECYGHLPTASKSLLPIANKASDSVLALPLYGDLPIEDIAYICEIIHTRK